MVHLAVLRRSPTRPRASRTGSGGRSRPTPRRLSPPRRRRPHRPRAPCASLAEGSTARCWWSTATATRSRRHRDGRALARLADGAARGGSRRRPLPARPQAGPGQPGAARLLRGRLRAASARRATRHVYRPDGRPRALFISSPIGLGHAQRDVAIARELRRWCPTCRSTGSPRTRSPGCWRARASASIPPARTWPTSRGTSSRSPPSTTCTASRRCGAWTRSSPPTSCSSTTSCATSATTSGSATRRGSSTTTCTRTRARSGSRSRG